MIIQSCIGYVLTFKLVVFVVCFSFTLFYLEIGNLTINQLNINPVNVNGNQAKPIG